MGKLSLVFQLCFGTLLWGLFTFSLIATDQIDKAKNLFRQAKYKEVVDLLKSHTKESTKNAMVFKLRGYAHYKMGKYQEAIKDYGVAEQIDNKQDETLFNNRGLAYAKNGNCTDALKDFQTALKIKPQYPQAYNNAANCHHMQKQNRKACKYWAKASIYRYQPAMSSFKRYCR